MKQGDFSKLAEAYVDRPSYGNLIRDSLLKLVEFPRDGIVADVGAGTGKWTKQNDMRAQAREELWQAIMQKIREKVSPYKDEIMEVSYRIRAWTVRRVD